MKFAGGYNILLEGRPSDEVQVLPEPTTLYLPLRSRRFAFSNVLAGQGQRVGAGQVLANDPDSYSVPLLAPRAGTVRLGAVEDHIVLEDVERSAEEPYRPREDAEHIPGGAAPADATRHKLLDLGAWQFFSDAFTGSPADPSATPSAVIVSTMHLEPYVARGDVQVCKRLGALTRGLEHLQTLLEYQPIYLVLPDVESALARKVHDTIRGYAFVKLVQVPLRYPFDHFALLGRRLGLKRDADNPVWALPTAGVLALDRALTASLPCTARIVSLGGPGVNEPMHLKAIPGYPLKDILDGRTIAEPARIISGGLLTGRAIPEGQAGLDAECSGLTVVPEHTRRELFAWTRPGLDRRSYSRCFLSSLRRGFAERLNTALRGERRACIACGQCVTICPAGIMPSAIHKYFYGDQLEQVQRMRVDLCVECGLCSYVCPSKIDLCRELIDAKQAVREELEAPPEGEPEDGPEAPAQTEEARA